MVRFKGGLGVVPPAGIKGGEPVGGGQGAKPPVASAFSKKRLQFVQQVDGTIITKLVIKSYVFSFYKRKSGTANAVSVVAVPTALIYWFPFFALGRAIAGPLGCS